MDTNIGKTPVGDLMEGSHLAHYGVKGMRWGVRNDKPSRASNMSDEELRNAVNRMRLEQQYKQLTVNPAVHAGRKQVSRYFNQALGIVMSAALSATVGRVATNVPAPTHH